MTLLLVGSAFAVPAAAATQAGDAAASEGAGVLSMSADANNSSADDNATSPGSILSGVLGVQEAEFEGSIERAAFGLRVAQAASANATADVVGDQLNETSERLDELQERKQELEDARENGSISNATFRAEMATLATEIETAQQLANETGDVAEGLPEDVLESNGVNVSAIQTLKTQAANMTGPEVAKIARSIAGPDAGGPSNRIPDFVNAGGNSTMGPGNNTNAGPGNNTTAGPGNETTGGPGDDDSNGPGQSGQESMQTFTAFQLVAASPLATGSL